jgi:hypothetical protein
MVNAERSHERGEVSFAELDVREQAELCLGALSAAAMHYFEAASHGTHRVSARRDLRDNPRLVLIAPCPPPTDASEHFQPADRLRDSTMFSVHSKPNGQNQTADSQITTSSERWSRDTAYVRRGDAGDSDQRKSRPKAALQTIDRRSGGHQGWDFRR